MKKKMTVLCGLLMAVLVTAYSVSGTYAKYTSSMDTTDSARVARWSINVGDGPEAKTLKLFSNTYGENGEVDSTVNDGALVVAPGTEGEYTFKFDGSTEVAYTLTVKVDAAKSINNVVYKDADDESPIKFTIDNGNTWFEFDELETKLKTAIEKDGKVYDAGKVSITPITLKWRWAYDAKDLKDNMKIDPTAGLDYDALDTELGQRYAKAYKAAYDASIATQISGSYDKLEDAPEAMQATFKTNADLAAKNDPVVKAAEPTITLVMSITATQVQP